MTDVETRARAAVTAFEAAGMRVAEQRMLEHDGAVLQFALPAGDATKLRAILDAHFGPCDLLVSDRPIVVPNLLVSDMDSTMIGQECIDELADFAGLKPQIADITERAMRGELPFAEALAQRVALLAGLDEDAVARCLAKRITPTPGARVLVHTLRARGCRTVLVTGGFHHFADAIGAQLGFDRVVGNRLAIDGGKLSGALVGPLVDSNTKLRVLKEEVDALPNGAVTMAAGDGANDIPMLQGATYGIAYRAKPVARAAADGWVERGDLTALLRLLEIPQSEWVTGETS